MINIPCESEGVKDTCLFSFHKVTVCPKDTLISGFFGKISLCIIQNFVKSGTFLSVLWLFSLTLFLLGLFSGGSCNISLPSEGLYKAAWALGGGLCRGLSWISWCREYEHSIKGQNQETFTCGRNDKEALYQTQSPFEGKLNAE